MLTNQHLIVLLQDAVVVAEVSAVDAGHNIA
jgi:hypothetical protein